MFNKIKNTIYAIYKTNKNILFISAFLIIVFLSLFPRSIEVLNQNPIFGFDQGRDYLAAKNIVEDKKLTLIGAEIGSGSAAIHGIFQGPFYYYFLAIAYLFSNGNPNTPVLFMLILSLIAIAFSFYFGKKLFGIYGGLTTALLVAVSPSLITQARFAWAPYPESIFILLSLYFSYYFYERNKIKIFLAAFFAGFIYNFEFAVAVPLCLGLLVYAIYIFRRNISGYIVLLLGFFVAFSPMVLFEMRHGFMGIRGFIEYLMSDKSNIVSFYPSTQALILDHWSSFLYNVSNTFPQGGFLSPAIILGFLLIFSVYLLRREKNHNLKTFITFLILLFPINFLVFYFLKNTVWGYYLTDLNFVYIFIFSYLLYASFENKSYKIFIAVGIFILLLILSGTVNAVKTSLYDYSDYGGTAKLKGKIDAIDYIYKDAKGKPFGALAFSPPIYTYPYDYLFSWYGNKKYNYIPYSEKKGTFYLLIEKDPNKPWSYKGWLETVIKSGKIIYTKTLPSGFIVQKRVEK